LIFIRFVYRFIHLMSLILLYIIAVLNL